MRTLVVDDDLMSRLVLAEFLLDYGEPDVVNDGLEAVRACQTAMQEDLPYDLILLDIMMPNMNGIEALGKIREIEEELDLPSAKRAVIMMVTAISDETKKAEAFAGNCNAYLSKPVNMVELFDTLKEFKLI